MIPLAGGFELEVQAGDGERFVVAFAAAWRKIPLAWRRRLGAYFTRPRRDGTRRTQRFVLQKRSLDAPGARRRNGETTLAATNRWEGLFRFYAPVLDKMPLRLVSGIIGHELAHNIQYAVGGSRAVSEIAMEREVDWICRALGFPVDEIDEWIDERREQLLRIARGGLMR